MRILIADDEPISRNVLKKALTGWDHEVIEASDGEKAWEILSSDDGPGLALLDWVMPGISGIDIVRKVRESLSSESRYIYLILLTQKGSKEEIVSGLDAGADDYMVKPFDYNELRVRIRSGNRIVDLHSELVDVNRGLQDALAKVKTLSGLLPICSSCKKIRDDSGYWRQIEEFVRDHSEADFTHGLCPQCAKKLYPEFYKGE